MKVLHIPCFIFAIICTAHCALQELSAHFPKYRQYAPNPDISYQTLYYQQQVDHFGFANQDVYKMRYLLNDQHWDSNDGPIFFYCGNEGDIAWFCNNTGAMWEWAPEFNAMIVFAEHRYYGESMPYGNQSYDDISKLGYLSSEQALADFSTLLSHLKESIPGAAKSPVIAFGGSYGGMLASWFRMKYPNIVQGSLAASAPIWMFGDLTPCDAFYKTVTADFKNSGPNCAENIQKSWAILDQMGTTEDGLKFLTDTFKLCKPLKSAADVFTLKMWLYETYGNLAMVDYPYAASFLEPLPAWPIKEVCKYLSNNTLDNTSLVIQLVSAISVYYNHTGQATCFNTSNYGVRDLGDYGWQFQAVCSHLNFKSATEDNHLIALFSAVSVYFNNTGTTKCLNVDSQAVEDLGAKGWDFQACSEMFMPQCSTGVDDMFESMPFNITTFAQDCKKKWGVELRPKWAIDQYGGKDIRDVTNIIFSNGALDPWSGGGVLTDLSPSLVSVMIADGAHHLDLRASNPDDPESVKQAREQEKSIIRKWIKEYHEDVHMEYIMKNIPLLGHGEFRKSPWWVQSTAMGIAVLVILLTLVSLFLLLKSAKPKAPSSGFKVRIQSPFGFTDGRKGYSDYLKEEKSPLLA